MWSRMFNKCATIGRSRWPHTLERWWTFAGTTDSKIHRKQRSYNGNKNTVLTCWRILDDLWWPLVSGHDGPQQCRRMMTCSQQVTHCWIIKYHSSSMDDSGVCDGTAQRSGRKPVYQTWCHLNHLSHWRTQEAQEAQEAQDTTSVIIYLPPQDESSLRFHQQSDNFRSSVCDVLWDSLTSEDQLSNVKRLSSF